MENQIRLDSSLFLTAILLGFIFGLFYEVLRFLRLAFPSHPSILIFWEDLTFFLLITPIFLLFNFAFSDGILRWFTLTGAGIGFLLYFGTLWRILLFFNTAILNAIRRILRFFARLFLIPMLNIIKKVTNKTFTRWRKIVIIRKEKRIRKRRMKMKEALIRAAERGFG